MKPIRRVLVGVKDPAGALVARGRQGRAPRRGLRRRAHAVSRARRAGRGRARTCTSTAAWRSSSAGRASAPSRQLERIAEGLRSRTLEVRVDADWDYPVHEAIVRHARRIKADLVVAEAHAGRRLAPWLLHLTDWELLRTCPVPVLIVKSPRMWKRPRVLAAIDPLHAFAKPAGLDAEVLEAGAQVADALRGALHALHTYTIPAFRHADHRREPERPRGDRRPPRKRRPSGPSTVRCARRGFPRTRRHLRLGHAAEAIPRAARSLRGRHRRHGRGLALRAAPLADRQHRRAHPRRPVLRRIGGQAGPLRHAGLPHPRGVRYTVSTAVPMPY